MRRLAGFGRGADVTVLGGRVLLPRGEDFARDGSAAGRASGPPSTGARGSGAPKLIVLAQAERRGSGSPTHGNRIGHRSLGGDVDGAVSTCFGAHSQREVMEAPLPPRADPTTSSRCSMR